MIQIIVHGADTFVAATRAFTLRIPDDVARDAGKGAAEVTIEAARPLVPVLTGRAANSLAVVATQQGAIVEGGEGVEYYGWLEYGGDSGRGHATHRTIVGNGRYIEPSYQSQRVKIDKIAEDALAKALRSAGLTVT